MAEKKYKGRRAYLNDFKKDEKGNYEYQGDLYYWAGEKDALRKELMILWILCSAMVALIITAGCVEAPGSMNSFYVVLPYTISFVCGVTTAWGMWRLFEGGNPLRAYNYKASVEQIPVRSIGIMICAGAAALGEIVFLFRSRFENHVGKSILFVLLEVAAVLFAAILRKKVMKMPWEKKSKIDKS